ncbi:MAG: GspH/FimT family pseudopilin [Betaproteobacteria bacterium]|nr:MAG: GspH/FimT family pseudopilin [Betaproteobacteria bacterium]
MHAIGKTRGFTLVEVLVTISVLAVLASLATPMYQSISASNSTRAAAYSLVAALSRARSEAVKRNVAVSVFPLGTGWQDGWEVETGGTRLLMNEPATNLVLSGPLAGVSYQPNGRLATPGIVLFTVSAATGYTRCVLIDPGGRATLNPGERNDGSCT